MIDNDSYPYSFSGSYLSSSFISRGPNGDIQKIAQFSEIEPGYYNFGFGDLDPDTGIISDTTTSNNGDFDLIMNTLGNIIKDFLSVNPDISVYVKGSDDTRTRLYQMQLNKHWNAIKHNINVQGYRAGAWHPFEKNVNYQAFIVTRKD